MRGTPGEKAEGGKKEEEIEEGGDRCSWANPKEEKGQGDPLSCPGGGVPNAEPLLVPEVPPGAAPVAMEQRPSMDEQHEAHLLGTDPPATVAQQSQTAPSSMAPQVPDIGGFLAGLRKSIPQAGA